MFPMFQAKKLPLLTAVVFFYFSIQAAKAAPFMENPKEVNWEITAATVTYDNKKQIYIARDHVVITGGKTRLETDYLEFSNLTKDAKARGNVLFVSGNDTIACDAMEINLATHTGSISQGTIFIQEENFYIKGDNIRKTGEFTYDAKNGSITSCDGDNPDWKISGKDIKVTVEGYGQVTHAKFLTKNIPVLYFPYLTYPVTTKRKTGLLLPEISSSTRKGHEYEQPLFIAVSRNTDATVSADYMAKRGVKVGGEFRYVLDSVSKGMVQLDYLNDRQIGDSTQANADYSYESTPDRTNRDRYWFRMKHDQALDYGFNAKLDLDIVSDADYLLEFRDGFFGYDNTNQDFNTIFGRGLDEYDDTTRKNSLIFSKSWSAYNFNAQALWYDNVEARQEDTQDTTLQTLPSIEFDAARQQVGGSGLYYTLDSEFRSFYRQDTVDAPSASEPAKINGQRMDIYPRFYYPMRLVKSFSFEPYIGARATAWNTDAFTDVNGNAVDDGLSTRATYDLGAELSTKLNRIFNPDNSFAEKIKHEIIPKLEYAFQPDETKDDLPYFDSLDKIEKKNLLTWSLASSFTARTPADTPATNNYREFIWFKFYQDYNIETELDDDPAIEQKPWSDIFFESEINPFSYFSMDADLAWNPYSNRFNEIKVGAKIQDNRGDSIYTSYRLDENTAPNIHSWYTKLTLKLTDYLAGYYSFENDLEENKTIENRAGIMVTQPCWGLGIEYKDASGDKTISFMVNLRGIGGFGTI